MDKVEVDRRTKRGSSYIAREEQRPRMLDQTEKRTIKRGRVILKHETRKKERDYSNQKITR